MRKILSFSMPFFGVQPLLMNYGFNLPVDGIEVEEFSSWSGKSSIFKPISSLIPAIHSEPTLDFGFSCVSESRASNRSVHSRNASSCTPKRRLDPEIPSGTPDEDRPYSIGIRNLYVGSMGSIAGTGDFGVRIQFHNDVKKRRTRADSFEEYQKFTGTPLSQIETPVLEREFAFKFPDGFEDSTTQSKVYIYSYLKDTLEKAIPVLDVGNSVHLVCQAGRSRSAIMGSGIIMQLHYLAKLPCETETQAGLALSLSKQDTNCLERVFEIINFMKTAQLADGRQIENLIKPNIWFQYQLAVLMLYKDNNNNLPEAGFRALSELFHTHVATNRVSNKTLISEGYTAVFLDYLNRAAGLDFSEAGHAEANSIFVEFSRELSISFPKSRTESNEG